MISEIINIQDKQKCTADNTSFQSDSLPSGDTEQKPRPLKVIMKDTNKKMELFKRLSNLRDADDKYKCLSFQHDLTKKERQERRKILEEARTKEINDKGKWL